MRKNLFRGNAGGGLGSPLHVYTVGQNAKLFALNEVNVEPDVGRPH